jgi:UDP-N-acetylmuramate dehydrogenase
VASGSFEERAAALVGRAAVRAGVPLADLTTFRVGGPADWFVEIREVGHLTGVLGLAREAGLPVTVLGGGSNVVIADEGIRGVVIRLLLTAIWQPAPDRVRAEAGVTMNGLVRWTIGRGLAGLEAWAGTPGTVGGAIFGNAHFGGRNIGDLVQTVEIVSRDGVLATVPRPEMGFAYDTSRLRETGELVVSADFSAAPGEPDALRATARSSLAYRKRTQPLAQPSAGCVFQNPDQARETVPAGIPASAGALVDRAGLKGHRIGGACISSTHANFVVNDGRATARDIRALVEAARAAVRDQFGVLLRDEVVFLGEFERD